MQILRRQVDQSPTGTLKSTAIAPTSTPLLRSQLVLAVAQTGTAGAATVTDNYGNTWYNYSNRNSIGLRIDLWGAQIDATGPGFTVTATSPATAQRLALAEYTGVRDGIASVGSSNASGTGTLANPGAAGVSDPRDMTITAMTFSAGTTTLAPHSPATQIAEDENTSSSAPFSFVQIANNAGALAAQVDLGASRTWVAASFTLGIGEDDPPFQNLPRAFDTIALPAAPAATEKIFTRTRSTHADGLLETPALDRVQNLTAAPWYNNHAAGEQPRFTPPGGPGGCHVVLKFTGDTTDADPGDPTAWYVNDTSNAPTTRPYWFRGVAWTNVVYVPADGTYYTLTMEETADLAPILDASIYPQITYIPADRKSAWCQPGGRPLAPRQENASTT